MYLDESGDPRLTRIYERYPVFVLGGVIVDRAYAREVIDPALRAFKLAFFGTQDVVLHTVDIRRNSGVFASLLDPGFRSAFFDELNRLIDSFEIQVVATAINKPEYRSRYGDRAQHPYLHCVESLVDQFCTVLGEARDAGFICAEHRNAALDRDILAAWEALRTGQSAEDDLRAHHIEERIVGFEIRRKHPARSAMQLADLVVTPIGRWLIDAPYQRDRIQWEVVERKLQLGDGRLGLVTRP
ncbi:MAG: DUF3800 domain-containing protein [Thermomicrobiales bacterium]|nr:DUF3800 domain-containing protein [Thermomicrobiales bacterium]